MALFNKRQTRIITAIGLTEPITAGDGIEQGEVISPLVWRIFYDPLLTRVQKDITLGYEIQVSWQTDLEKQELKTQKVRQAVVAFADNTTWIASYKEQLNRTIQIAQKFFKINDIQINPTKSKLIVMNSKIKPEEKKILLKEQEIFLTKEKELVRFLGTWIGHKVGKKQVVAKAKQITKLFANIIRKKLLSASQILYVNNVCLL